MRFTSRDTVRCAFFGRRRVSAGFSLIELLTVMAIITILIGLAFGLVRGAKQRAAIARARGELAAFAQALEDYKRHYGDYPQTGSASQATAAVTSTIGATTAQSLLFNALTGVYGPNNFSTRLNGPMLIEISKFRLEVEPDDTRMKTTFAIPTGTPPAKPVIANSFLDPWGNRYLYYYRTPIIAGRPSPNMWRASSYVLYSAGPDGQQTPPNSGTGLYTGTTQTTGTNADNLYANP